MKPSTEIREEEFDNERVVEDHGREVHSTVGFWPSPLTTVSADAIDRTSASSENIGVEP